MRRAVTDVEPGQATQHARSRSKPRSGIQNGRVPWSGAWRSRRMGSALAIAQQAIDRPPSIFRIWDLAQRRDIAWFGHPLVIAAWHSRRTVRILVAGNFDGTLSSLLLPTAG